MSLSVLHYEVLVVLLVVDEG